MGDVNTTNSGSGEKTEKISPKVWALFGAAIAAVVAIVGILIAVIVINNKPSEPGILGEPVKLEYEGVEVDDIVFAVEGQIVNMSEEDAYNYLDGQIRKYRGTNAEPRLIIMKARLYSSNEHQDDALRTLEGLDENSLSNEYKLLYYRLMETIYKIKADTEKSAEYSDKYWGLFDGMSGVVILNEDGTEEYKEPSKEGGVE
ncbi:MAG: hypothetical protein Q4A36_03315 [Candidatus Saccharibacteria bacterium]|nr:hypothetical protein [Candidatus Saccharibacteria bacterium]